MALNSASTTSDSESEVSEVRKWNIKTDDEVFHRAGIDPSLCQKKNGLSLLILYYCMTSKLWLCSTLRFELFHFYSSQAYWSLEWSHSLSTDLNLSKLKLVHLWFGIFKFPPNSRPVGLLFSTEFIPGRFFSYRGRRQHRNLGAGAWVLPVPAPATLPGAGVPAPAGSRCWPGDSGQAWGSPRGCRYLSPVWRVKTVGRPGHSETADFLSQVRPGFHMEHIPPGQSLHQYKVLMGNISSVLLEGFIKDNNAARLLYSLTLPWY